MERRWSKPVVVKPDPRDTMAQADYQAGFDFAMKYSAASTGKIDDVLNNLDAVQKSLEAAMTVAKSDPR